MNLTSNIVLTGNKGPTNSYMVQLLPGVVTVANDIEPFVYRRQDEEIYPAQHVTLTRDDCDYTRVMNEWYPIDKRDGHVFNLVKSKIRVYFPDYSADTYETNVRYMLTASTFIHGVEIELGSFLFRRSDGLGHKPVNFGRSNEYYNEYVEFVIADPYELQYGELAEDVRDLCGKPREYNNIGSELHVSLHVVDEIDDHFIERVGWTGGYNEIPIVDIQDLKLDAYIDENKKLHFHLSYNDKYKGNIRRYIAETYGVTRLTRVWEVVILNNTDVYGVSDLIETNMGMFNKDSYNVDFNIDRYPLSDDMIIDLSEFNDVFETWADGLSIEASLSFVNNAFYYIKTPITSDTDEVTYTYILLPNPTYAQQTVAVEKSEVPTEVTEDSPEYIMIARTYTQEDFEGSNWEPFISVISNKIPLTQENYSLLYNREGTETFPEIIDYTNLNMDTYNITAINKIEQVITTVTPNDSTKSHIIQPIFFQTRTIGNVIIHSQVTENICINLDAYKANVESFMIKVEGMTFKEIGRVAQGVIFKVNGNTLPGEVKSGVIYILDQDGVLVTTGKYTYVS